LTRLYGPAAADDLYAEWEDKVSEFRDRTTPLPDRPLDERDVLLITYGDQVREPGVPPLRSLSRFLDEWTEGLLSGVHLLPFYPYSSDDGFAVMDYYAVDPALGGWEDIASIRQHRDLMFDAVLNHVSSRNRWFQAYLHGDPAFEDWFIAVEVKADLSRVIRPRTLPLITPFQTAGGERRLWTTFSADQVDLNYQNPRVLLRMLDVLLFYAGHGARFLRLDAIGFLWKETGTTCLHLDQTHTVIQLFRESLDRAAPSVKLITETNVPHADNITYFGNGSNEAQLVYNFALPPLVLHSLLTGSAEKLSRWAASLTWPSDRATFLNFLASHDGIGLNPARGILEVQEIDALVAAVRERGGLVSLRSNSDGTASPYELNINYLDALSDEPGENGSSRYDLDRFITAHAILLALRGVPAIYFHSLFGSRGDLQAARESGQPRRINRAKLLRADLEAELVPLSRRWLILQRLARLLRARRAHPAFHPNASQHILDIDPRIFALQRTSPDSRDRVLCLHNVSSREVGAVLPPVQPGEQWTQLLKEGSMRADESGTLVVRLEPYETAWLHHQSESPA
ncbi:MAG: sugar phosphorylase, partial [Rudaea sp.]